LGICICYDLSYSRVTDRLVRQGAQALVVPSMDVTSWGKREHELDARVTPVRAAEYGLPIFRVASSGISQLVDAAGNVQAQAPFPGEGEMIGGELALGAAGRLPMDRWLAPLSVGVAALTALWLLIRAGADWLQGGLLRPRKENEPCWNPKV
jgi:apolipoprotein N-acyltransferase